MIPASLETRRDKATILTVTKLDAARRQLNTAIELWFTDGDEVSIHTLAFAAHEIIHRAYRSKGLKDLLYDSESIKEEYRADINKALKQAAVFFKHANRDKLEEVSISFTPEGTVLFILMSIIGLHRMGEALNDFEQAFSHWHQLHRPSWFAQPATNSIPVDVVEKLRSRSPREFFEGFVQFRAAKRTAQP